MIDMRNNSLAGAALSSCITYYSDTECIKWFTRFWFFGDRNSSSLQWLQEAQIWSNHMAKCVNAVRFACGFIKKSGLTVVRMWYDVDRNKKPSSFDEVWWTACQGWRRFSFSNSVCNSIYPSYEAAKLQSVKVDIRMIYIAFLKCLSSMFLSWIVSFRQEFAWILMQHPFGIIWFKFHSTQRSQE